jgi:outer membrane protein TolC
LKNLIGLINRRIPWVIVLGMNLALSVRADSGAQYSFVAIWKAVRAHSPELSAANHDLEGARIYEKRMSRHWYPRVFAEGRAFSTNDPALTFMSLLGQRQIAASDFAPQALNYPGSNFFERGTLGLDLPIYEGGSKVAMVQASVKMTEARSFELRSAEITKYTDLAQTYSSILSLQKQHHELQKLKEGVEDILSHYSIGTKSNPVGYSGLLGLKNLRNRLEGLLAENSAKSSSLRERIHILAESLPENWIPQSDNVREFIEMHLSSLNQSNPTNESPDSVRAMNLAAESLDQSKEAEKAQFLPKVGLFGTGNLYGGSRGTGTSYTAGAYLQWDLFSAPNFGAVAQAEHTAAAAQARADGMNERARIERSGARQSASALEKNLSLMDESSQLLEEQTATARGLFRNGSINALQLVEVLARRADLLVSRAEAELGLAQARATLLVNSGVKGVSHEN